MISWDLFISKSRAFGIHFAISFSIFLALLYFIVFHWYPLPFFNSDGGWQGIRLIIFVDLVLGPTLTFIVFNPKKPLKLLKIDLSMIALCQIAALTWGTWAVHNERPYLVVFADGVFYPLSYYQIADTGLKHEDLNKLGADNPPIKVYIDIPLDPNEYMRLLHKAAATQPIHFMVERYEPFADANLEKISRYSLDMNTYLDGEPEEWHEEYQQFVKSHKDKLNDMLYFPLSARYGKYIVAFDKQSMEFSSVLNIPPPSIDEVFRGKKEAKRRLRQVEQKNAKKPETPLSKPSVRDETAEP